MLAEFKRLVHRLESASIRFNLASNLESLCSTDTKMSIEELPGGEIAPGESSGRLHMEDAVGIGILLVFPMTLHSKMSSIYLPKSKSLFIVDWVSPFWILPTVRESQIITQDSPDWPT